MKLARSRLQCNAWTPSLDTTEDNLRMEKTEFKIATKTVLYTFAFFLEPALLHFFFFQKTKTVLFKHFCLIFGA